MFCEVKIMGKFDGILLCADFDGTIRFDGINPKNTEAIDYFIENGGMFTMITGRGGDAELTSDILSVRTNVPGCTMIGAQTFDFGKKEILESVFMPEDSADMIRRISDYIGEIRLIKLYCIDHDVLFSNADAKEFEDGLAQIDSTVCKIVIVLGYKYTAELFAEVEKICGSNFNVCSNGSDYFEITARGISKGNAALKLKERYGAKLLVCAGDSNGDITMIKAADIGYAVDNAIDDLKSAADRITVHAKDGAIAEIVKDLGSMRI